MKVKGEIYCDFCFCSFGIAEPRKYGGPVWEEKVYHLLCFRRMEIQEMIVKDIKLRQPKKKGV